MLSVRGFNEVAPGGASQAPGWCAAGALARASTKSLLVERVRPFDGPGDFSVGVASTKSLLVERVRPLRLHFDGPNDAASTKSLLVERVRLPVGWRGFVTARASTKSLLVERVRRGSASCRACPAWLQRSRSWWSESGPCPPSPGPCPLTLQRSRSWWSESGEKLGENHACSILLQRSRSWWSESGMVSIDLALPVRCASTKSLLVERVRRFIQMPLILK